MFDCYSAAGIFSLTFCFTNLFVFVSLVVYLYLILFKFVILLVFRLGRTIFCLHYCGIFPSIVTCTLYCFLSDREANSAALQTTFCQGETENQLILKLCFQGKSSG